MTTVRLVTTRGALELGATPPDAPRCVCGDELAPLVINGDPLGPACLELAVELLDVRRRHDDDRRRGPDA